MVGPFWGARGNSPPLSFIGLAIDRDIVTKGILLEPLSGPSSHDGKQVHFSKYHSQGWAEIQSHRLGIFQLSLPLPHALNFPLVGGEAGSPGRLAQFNSQVPSLLGSYTKRSSF